MNFSLLCKSEVSITLLNMGLGNSRNARKNTGVFQLKLYNINALTPNDLYMRRAVSPLNSRMTYTYVANCVSKFGAILFTPIWLTFVGCYAAGPLKVRLSYRSQNVPPPPPKPLHKHQYIYQHFTTNCKFFPAD